MKKNDKEADPGAKKENQGSGGDKLWISNTQILKRNAVAGAPAETASPEPSKDLFKKDHDIFLQHALKVRDRIKNDQDISPSPILADLHDLIKKDRIDEVYNYAMSMPDEGKDILVHTIDVTFAALRMGKGMGYDTKRLLQLGLAAFLENVGMYKIPDSILDKKGRLTKAEIETIQKHPDLSAEILSRMGKRYQWLGKVARQVHERADGSGYPRGLKKNQIHEIAAIIGLIDVYVAMIKKRPYRRKFIQTDAVKSIIKDAKKKFPAPVLRMFLTQISLFPVNTIVRLNNRSIGRVVATDKSQPLRPKLELLYDSNGNRIQTQKIIRLSDNPLLHITESINEEDLSQANI